MKDKMNVSFSDEDDRMNHYQNLFLIFASSSSKKKIQKD
jgi:hypothetical protein